MTIEKVGHDIQLESILLTKIICLFWCLKTTSSTKIIVDSKVTLFDTKQCAGNSIVNTII